MFLAGHFQQLSMRVAKHNLHKINSMIVKHDVMTDSLAY